MVRLTVLAVMALGVAAVGASQGDPPAEGRKRPPSPAAESQPKLRVTPQLPKQMPREERDRLVRDLTSRGEAISPDVIVEAPVLDELQIVRARISPDMGVPARRVAAVVEALLDLGVTDVSVNAKRAPPKLPPGVITLDLPEDEINFLLVQQAGERLVQLKSKNQTLRAPRLFVRDGNNVLLFEASKDDLKETSPDGFVSYCDNLTWVKGTRVIGPSRDGGFGRIQRGDIVVTHPRFKIEVQSQK